ncbi:MAG: TetR/AcrR family transcriptional regulator [Halocynthiibacter sp.]
MQTIAADLTPKARRTRVSLLEAGQRLIGLHGAAGVNVMSVCAEAGVGRTSFYNYFDDVEALTKAIAVTAARGIKNQFDQIHLDCPRGRERLFTCLEMILSLAVETPDTILLVTSLAQSDPEIGNLLRSEIQAELSAAGGHDPSAPLADFITVTVLALARHFAEQKLPAQDIDAQLNILRNCIG